MIEQQLKMKQGAGPMPMAPGKFKIQISTERKQIFNNLK